MVSISSITGNLTGVIVGVIGAVLFLVLGITLGPTVTTYFGYINATSMSGVTMGNILILFADYAPLFYYLAFIGGSITILVGAVKYVK